MLNSKVHQIAEECGLICAQIPHEPTNHIWKSDDAGLEKFAHTVVQECAALLQYKNQALYDEDFCHMTPNELLHYFGVKVNRPIIAHPIHGQILERRRFERHIDRRSPTRKERRTAPVSPQMEKTAPMLRLSYTPAAA